MPTCDACMARRCCCSSRTMAKQPREGGVQCLRGPAALIRGAAGGGGEVVSCQQMHAALLQLPGDGGDDDFSFIVFHPQGMCRLGIDCREPRSLVTTEKKFLHTVRKPWGMGLPDLGDEVCMYVCTFRRGGLCFRGSFRFSL
jgi:hypothetical protein